MTLKVDKHTKSAMDIIAARLLAKTGKAHTVDDVILAMIQEYDPAALELAHDSEEYPPRKQKGS